MSIFIFYQPDELWRSRKEALGRTELKEGCRGTYFDRDVVTDREEKDKIWREELFL